MDQSSEAVIRARSRIVARLARFLEANLAELESDDPLRHQLEAIARVLVDGFGLAPLDEANGYLAATQDELRERLRQAGLTPFEAPTPEQAAILLRGLPFTLEELSLASQSAAAEWVTAHDGTLPTFAVAGGLHSAGTIQGGLAVAWSR